MVTAISTAQDKLMEALRRRAKIQKKRSDTRLALTCVEADSERIEQEVTALVENLAMAVRRDEFQ